jgi:hypothetical protein
MGTRVKPEFAYNFNRTPLVEDGPHWGSDTESRSYIYIYMKNLYIYIYMYIYTYMYMYIYMYMYVYNIYKRQLSLDT